MIRLAKHKDISILTKWRNKLLKHIEATTYDAYFQGLGKLSEKKWTSVFRKSIEAKDSIIFIAEYNNGPSGFIMGKITRPFFEESKIKNIGYVHLCWVDPDARNKGLARSLVREIEKWFKEKGIIYVDLNFMVGNIEAEEMWDKLGYTPYRITSRKKI